jgi:hypothetical protein
MTMASTVDFRRHAVDLGSDEAGRVSFHRMLSALIGIEFPNATDVRPDPGDWGIDVFVGSLVDTVMVWQSKYFYTDIGKSQRQQILDSFASAMQNATSQGYTIEAWTLCVACELSAPERKWWDGKVREWAKTHPDLTIALWDAPVLRRRLMSPDASHVLNEFYGARLGESPTGSRPSPAISGEETPDYATTLFVKQMRVAGIERTDAQRKAFFNADLLARDVDARAIPEEIAAMSELDGMLLAGWEDSVANPDTAPNANDYGGSARKLFGAVMTRSEAVSSPAELSIRPIHGRGLMHRIVEDARAGWVHDWELVADGHRSEDEAN